MLTLLYDFLTTSLSLSHTWLLLKALVVVSCITRFNGKKFYVLSAEYVFVFSVDLQQ